jgi:hypothetical protein
MSVLLIAEWQINEWQTTSGKTRTFDPPAGSSTPCGRQSDRKTTRKAPAAATLRSPKPSNSSEHKQTPSCEAQRFRGFSPVFAGIRRK